MSSEIAVEVKAVSKRYLLQTTPTKHLKSRIFKNQIEDSSQHWALKNVSLELHRGETLGIMGRNGCGKSTLLEIIAGTLTATSGEVQINGVLAALLELGAGFDPELSGRENVYIYGSLLGMSRRDIELRFHEIIAFAELESYIDEPVKTYSSGMFMRLAFSVAVSSTPEILVVDEALAVGDEAFQRRCFARIEALKESGVSILFVSHSAGIVLELCDRALLLDRGESLLLGPPREVVSQYHRLVYAPAAEQESIRAEILAGSSAPPDSEGNPTEEPSADPNAQKVESLEQERLEPNLLSKSRLEYVSRGARINHCAIVSPEGAPLNILKRGKLYYLEVKATFQKPAYNVRCGMLIKTVVGTELGGIVSAPPSEGIEHISQGTSITARIPFRPRLTSDTYFSNVGIVAASPEGEVFLHRISDALTFRILQERNSVITSSVDFSASEKSTIKIED